MGRPRKPIEQLERDGTVREDRHAARRRAPVIKGLPDRPKGMSPDAQEFWDRHVPHLVGAGLATAIDAPALEQLCYWWGKLAKLKRKRGDSRELDLRISKAQDQWNALAAKFGFTPVDRTRIETPTAADSGNPFEQFLKDRMSPN